MGVFTWELQIFLLDVLSDKTKKKIQIGIDKKGFCLYNIFYNFKHLSEGIKSGNAWLLATKSMSFSEQR